MRRQHYRDVAGGSIFGNRRPGASAANSAKLPALLREPKKARNLLWVCDLRRLDSVRPDEH
jgi:hypothetical protein